MITSIDKVNENLVIISFDNRSDVSVVTDNGSAWHLVEALLSPHPRLTYTEYLSVCASENEDTQKIAA